MKNYDRLAFPPSDKEGLFLYAMAYQSRDSLFRSSSIPRMCIEKQEHPFSLEAIRLLQLFPRMASLD